MPLHHIGYFKKKPDRDPLTVSDYLSKIMFDVPRPNHRLDPVFVIADDSDARIGNRQTATDKAWMVIERFKKEGYYLFIDQRRMPHRGKFAYTKTCVVVRSYQDAIGVVTNKGKPKTVYIEENQSGTSHKAFKDWLDENHPGVTYVVHDEYVQRTKTEEV